jgi:hypothetical protein
VQRLQAEAENRNPQVKRITARKQTGAKQTQVSGEQTKKGSPG